MSAIFINECWQLARDTASVHFNAELISGSGVVSVPSGLIAAALTKVRQDMEQDTFGSRSGKIRSEVSRLPTNSRSVPHHHHVEQVATDLQGVDALLSIPLCAGGENVKRTDEVVIHQCEHCGTST